MSDNTADFPAFSPGQRVSGRMREIIAQIQSLAADQGSQSSRRSRGLKEDALNRLIRMIQMINRAAVAMDDEVDGVFDLFRMPRRRSQTIWLATARAFYNDSAPYESRFLEYDLPSGFRDELMAMINDVESAGSSASIAGGQRGGATGGLAAAFTEAGKLSRRLNAIVRNKYDENPQKLAAWTIAAHLEATGRPKAPAVLATV